MRLTLKAKIILSAAVLAVVGYTGWHYYQKRPQPEAAPVIAARPQPPPVPPGQTLRLAGSNTIGASLAPSLVRAWLAREGATGVACTSERITATLRGARITVEIRSPGSAVAFTCLRDDSCDIGMSSRAAKEGEAGDENILGLDGIAVIVNRKNPVTELTLGQVADLFSGQVLSWAAVGGKYANVHVFTRDARSGTWDAFTSTVLKGVPITREARSFEDSAALADAVAADEQAIGFVSLSQAGAARALALRDGEGQPLHPTVFTVATEDYPLSRRLRLFTTSSSPPLAHNFVGFALSDDGQRVVEKAGFVALTIQRQRVPLPPRAPSRYQAEVKDAERLSLDFRFRSGAPSLDTRGARDVERLVSFLSRPDERSRRLALFGFADNQGGDRANLELSQKRAQAVSAQLASRGVQVEAVVGFGSALPIAPNLTPEGRERNRRVEVWVR
jgi:phosphate transport system substrate-binding protein